MPGKVSYYLEPTHKYKEGVFKHIQYLIDVIERVFGEEFSNEIKSSLQKKYMVVFDSESYLQPIDGGKRAGGETDNLKFTHHHKMMTISAASNVPKFEKLFLVDDPETEEDDDIYYGNGIDPGLPPPANIMEKFIAWCLGCSEEAKKLYLNQPDIKKLLTKLDKGIEENNVEKPGLSSRCRNVKKELMKYAGKLVILSYNGGNYDMVTMREAGIFHYMHVRDGKKNIHTIKKANTYMLVETSSLRFVDILQFLGSKSSLRNYLKTYQPTTGQTDNEDLEKQYICYDFLSPETLHTRIEDIDYTAFTNSLCGGVNLLDEEHIKFQKLLTTMPEKEALKKMKVNTPPPTGRERMEMLRRKWAESGHKTLLHILKEYAMADVEPLLPCCRVPTAEIL